MPGLTVIKKFIPALTLLLFISVGVGLFQAQFRNFSNTEILLAYNPESMSKTLTRGGPLVAVPRGYEVDFSLSTDSRKPVVLSGNAMTYQRPGESSEWNANFSARWKPLPTIILSVGPTLGQEDLSFMWVKRISDATMTSTYGRRYIFARLNQKVIATDIRLDWTFTPRLTLQAYLQPFLAVGRYDRFKELARPGSFEWNVYGENGSTIESADGAYVVDPDGDGPAPMFAFGKPDFNYKSLRGTVVFRWEYRPGSLLYFVWTQNRADYANPGDFRLRRDLGDLLKVSYRWNM